MFKSNNSVVPNKVSIGWHFSSNKYTYRDIYSALKSKGVTFIASMAYSTWNRRPSVENEFTPRSYSDLVRNFWAQIAKTNKKISQMTLMDIFVKDN